MPEQKRDSELLDDVSSTASDRTALTTVISMAAISALYIAGVIGYQFGRKAENEVKRKPSEELHAAQTRIENVEGHKDLTAAKLALKTTWSPGILEKLQQATVRLTWQKSSKTSQASGFMLAPNIVVTARHAALNDNLTTVETADTDGSPLPIWHSSSTNRAEIILDSERDLAIVIFPQQISSAQNTLPPGNGILFPNTNVASCTNSPETFSTIKAGVVQNENPDSSLRLLLEIEQGNSGSAIIDINGRVVGIISDLLSSTDSEAPPRGMGIVVTEKILAALVHKAQQQYPHLFKRSTGIEAEIRKKRRNLEQVFSGRKMRQKHPFSPMNVRQKSMRN